MVDDIKGTELTLLGHVRTKTDFRMEAVRKDVARIVGRRFTLQIYTKKKDKTQESIKFGIN